jgi:outer membrane protein assembly factor BamB
LRKPSRWFSISSRKIRCRSTRSRCIRIITCGSEADKRRRVDHQIKTIAGFFRKFAFGDRDRGYAFAASPVADEKLYFTSEDGEIFVVKAGPQYELIATNSMGEVCMATPAISEGMIFVRTQGHVYGIGE